MVKQIIKYYILHVFYRCFIYQTLRKFGLDQTFVFLGIERFSVELAQEIADMINEMLFTGRLF